jgi:type IV secretion system protein VirD4
MNTLWDIYDTLPVWYVYNHLPEEARWALAAVFTAGFYWLSQIRKSFPAHRGSAHWMPLFRAIPFNWIAGIVRGPGLIVGDWRRWCMMAVFHGGSSNMLTVGAPGSMKGAGVLIPNALRWRYMFLFDPGGEISAVCMKAWRRIGRVVHLIDPWEMLAQGCAGFNPLDVLDPKSAAFSSDALLLARILIRPPKVADHWNLKAWGGTQGLIMFVKLHEPPARQNLVTLREYLRGDPNSWAGLIIRMKDSTDAVVRGQGNEWVLMSKAAPKEWAGIISTMESETKVLDDYVVRNCLSQSDVDFNDLRGRNRTGKWLMGTVVSVVIPLEYKVSHSVLTNLAIASSLIALQKKGGTPRGRILYMIDEFPALGRNDIVVDGLTTLRKYRIWFLLAIQGIGQLKDIYGDGASKVITGCSCKQFLRTNDPDTAEFVSRACGEETLVIGDAGNLTYIARRLVTPDEVATLPDDQQIAFLENRRPARLYTRPYWDRPSLRGLFNDNPYFGRTPSMSAAWPVHTAVGFVLALGGGYAGPFIAMTAAALTIIIGAWQ